MVAEKSTNHKREKHDVLKSTQTVIHKALEKLGYPEEFINSRICSLKDNDPNNRVQRVLVINEISRILKGVGVSYRPYYVHELLSKITGLSPNYIQVISNTINPENILKNGSKN